MAILIFDAERKDPGLVAILLEKGADSVMGDSLGPVNHGRLDEFFINAPAIPILRNITFSILENFEVTAFEISIE